eukprot:4580703-Prymnesium_polylepis.2
MPSLRGAGERVEGSSGAEPAAARLSSKHLLSRRKARWRTRDIIGRLRKSLRRESHPCPSHSPSHTRDARVLHGRLPGPPQPTRAQPRHRLQVRRLLEYEPGQHGVERCVGTPRRDGELRRQLGRRVLHHSGVVGNAGRPRRLRPPLACSA